MDYPDFMMQLPELDVPFPRDAVITSAVKGDGALVLYFTVLKDVEVPEHSHGPQWGALFHGEIELTVDGVTRRCKPGDFWDIPAGTLQAAKLKAGARLMDVFAETDRYPLRS